MSTHSWNAPELQVDSDSTWRARYRLLQSWYREHDLRVPPGHHSSGRLVGSMLPAAEVARRPSLNFLDADIAAYAERRAKEVRDAGGTLDPDRLSRNMLSSMPLCFNLFGALRSRPEEAAALLRKVLTLDVARVVSMEVEWAPPRGEHLEDRTAFDAFVEYVTSDGRRGFLGVETKYTEPFSQKLYTSDVYTQRTAAAGSGFRPGAADRLKHGATNQLWRNALLALSLREKQGFAHGHVVVLSCRDDAGAQAAVQGVCAELVDPASLVRHVALEDLVAAAAARPALQAWATAFERRYLDLSPVSART